ncbi:hypothetical protein LWI28_007693 [Acer negundo]|uniref:Uncharacterized protein n=1 Tax=Acer negundo TaxID=4023 RepID=A0AAD5NI32_ACENE|nr:hypothetical protein LWI28_007693 [Acer negundo]KAK4836929.1 hypothetical protein QYF36_001432 [Acer negundo]
MKDEKENFGEFFEVLAKDMGELEWCKVAPIFSTEKDDEFFAHSVLQELGGVDLAPFVMKRDKEICKSIKIATHDREVKSKKNKRSSHFFQDLTWNDFCKVALEDVYFARRCNSSKKLKFFKKRRN